MKSHLGLARDILRAYRCPSVIEFISLVTSTVIQTQAWSFPGGEDGLGVGVGEEAGHEVTN